MAMPPPQTGMRTAVGTSAGASAAGFGGGIREGKFTEQIYSMIRIAVTPEVNAVSSILMLITLAASLAAFRMSRDVWRVHV